MNKRYRSFGIYVGVIVIIAVVLMLRTGAGNISQEAAYTEAALEDDLAEGKVSSVYILPNREIPSGEVRVNLSDASERKMFTTDVNQVKELMREYDFKNYRTADIPEENWLLTFLPMLLTFGIVFIFYIVMTSHAQAGGGGNNSKMMNFGKSRARMTTENKNVSFGSVAGLREEKEDLEEIVDFLRYPRKYTKLGARIPKGVLLVGPPGTGKTLLAKAVAGEAHVPFFSLTGSDFIELYVGVGASRVRDLFKEASKNAPCIVFIDEIDAIGRSRDSKYGGGNEEREQTLNQLLSEMDGFDSSSGVLILAATNRPEILDKALLRPGRFDRQIIVDKPDLKGRVEILRVHAKDVLMDDTVDLDAIALATSGAVGSDLANMINEAAINAVKQGRDYVCQKDLFEAVEQVLVGKEKKDRIMSKEERRIVSYHEVGHALVSALQKNSEPVQKITIVPRTMGALGYVMQVPEEEKYLNTEAELHDMLVGLLAGRAAEEIMFDSITTGAANDIEKATGIARAMVTQYGMSKKFGLIGLQTVESKYLEGRASMNCSDVTAAEVDSEVMNILKECYAQALDLLRENRDLMDKLAGHLIEKETITGKEFMKIFRAEKGLPEPEEEKEKASKGEEGRERAQEQKAVAVPDGQRTKPDGYGLPPEPEQDGYGLRPEPVEDGYVPPSEPVHDGRMWQPNQQDDWWKSGGNGIPGQDMGFFNSPASDGTLEREDAKEAENGSGKGEGPAEEGSAGKPAGPVGRFSNSTLPPYDRNGK